MPKRVIAALARLCLACGGAVHHGGQNNLQAGYVSCPDESGALMGRRAADNQNPWRAGFISEAHSRSEMIVQAHAHGAKVVEECGVSLTGCAAN
jgi:hypothetical protein